jgi:hypothetical protein
MFTGGVIYLAKKIIRYWYFTCKKHENIICDGILHVNMFHCFKIPYFTCIFFTKFTYNEYIGPYFLSHVVLRFFASELPESSTTILSTSMFVSHTHTRARAHTHICISTIISSNSTFLYTCVTITPVQLSIFLILHSMHQCWSSIWMSVWCSSPMSFEKEVNITIINRILVCASHPLSQHIPMPY